MMETVSKVIDETKTGVAETTTSEKSKRNLVDDHYNSAISTVESLIRKSTNDTEKEKLLRIRLDLLDLWDTYHLQPAKEAHTEGKTD